MGRHLRACRKKVLVRDGEGNNPGQRAGNSLHIRVRDRYDPRYWMHIEVPQEFELRHLDGFLRTLWLECCGHLSAFYISGEMYQLAGEDWLSDFGGPRVKDMSFATGQVLRQGQSFTYDYDFGTTTELSLRVISKLAPKLRDGIQLLAINDPPRFTCRVCRKAEADVICVECGFDDFGDQDPPYLCDECQAEHACDDMMYLPVVNSPRAGMCGYVG